MKRIGVEVIRDPRLGPCPFCGEAKNIRILVQDFDHDDETDGYSIDCERCHARMHVVTGLAEQAIVTWNQRPGEPPCDDWRERYKLHAPENIYSKDELVQIANDMEQVSEKSYWTFFTAGMGSKCHAFLEFNGLISKYAQICGKAAQLGIDFTQANTHSTVVLPVEPYDVEYLAEKLACILGPLINAKPSARRAFAKAFFGPVRKRPRLEEPSDWLDQERHSS